MLCIQCICFYNLLLRSSCMFYDSPARKYLCKEGIRFCTRCTWLHYQFATGSRQPVGSWEALLLAQYWSRGPLWFPTSSRLEFARCYVCSFYSISFWDTSCTPHSIYCYSIHNRNWGNKVFLALRYICDIFFHIPNWAMGSYFFPNSKYRSSVYRWWLSHQSRSMEYIIPTYGYLWIQVCISYRRFWIHLVVEEWILYQCLLRCRDSWELSRRRSNNLVGDWGGSSLHQGSASIYMCLHKHNIS